MRYAKIHNTKKKKSAAELYSHREQVERYNALKSIQLGAAKEKFTHSQRHLTPLNLVCRQMLNQQCCKYCMVAPPRRW